MLRRESRLPKLLELAKMGKKREVFALLDSGDVAHDIECVDEEKGWTPLFWALYNGQSSFAEGLIERGANMHHVSFMEMTVLHVSARLTSSTLIDRFIGNGVDVNRVDLFNESPLWYAATHDSAKIVKRLLCAGADVNATSISGNAPLHNAARHSHLGVVTLLLQAGADPTQKTKEDKKIPAEIALDNDYDGKRIVDVLERYPRVPPLQVLCLRVVHYSKNKLELPEWLPPLFLRWPDVNWYLLPRKRE